MPPSEISNQRLAELYLQGGTLQSVADELGISREQVRHVVKELGIESPLAERRYNAVFPKRAVEVRAAFLALRNDEAVAEKTGIEKVRALLLS